jgi:exosortase
MTLQSTVDVSRSVAPSGRPVHLAHRAIGPLSLRSVAFGLYSLGLLLSQLDVVTRWWDLAITDGSVSYLLAVPVVSGLLLYRDRQAIFAAHRPSWRLGLCAIGAGLLVLVTVRARSAQVSSPLTWEVASLLTLWTGGFLLAFGHGAFRMAMFPLLFLGFAIPIPHGLLNAVVIVLKSGSALVVELLLTLTGTPHLRQGFVFTLPDLVIEIVDACSGIRSSIALLLTSLLLGHTFLKGVWRNALVVLAVLPISILKNGLRIAVLTLLALRVDPQFLQGRLHHEGGFVFFLLGLAVLWPLVAVLRERESKPAFVSDTFVGGNGLLSKDAPEKSSSEEPA